MHKPAWIFAAFLALAACRGTAPDGDKDTLSRQAGRAAYKAATSVEKAAEKAGKEIKKNAVEMKKGWNEAQHDAKGSKPAPPR